MLILLQRQKLLVFPDVIMRLDNKTTICIIFKCIL